MQYKSNLVFPLVSGIQLVIGFKLINRNKNSIYRVCAVTQPEMNEKKKIGENQMDFVSNWFSETISQFPITILRYNLQFKMRLSILLYRMVLKDR